VTLSPAPDSARQAPCPVCQHPITVADFDVDRGEIFACSACGAELELLGFDPLRLARAEPGEEDV
jgi:lysine biosynthesis protein LysW